jgi:hypothetical protein
LRTREATECTEVSTENGVRIREEWNMVHTPPSALKEAQILKEEKK